MELKAVQQEISFSRQAFFKSFTETVQGDIIVPDVKGDIAKILKTHAVAQIDSKEINGGRVTVSGTVFATVLYVPEGGGIDSLSTQMSFNSVTKAPDDNIRLIAECSVSDTDHSLYNSRKMNIRANVSVTAEGIRESTAQILTGVTADWDIETKCDKVTLRQDTSSASDVIVFRESLELPPNLPAVSSVLKCSASMSDKDFRLLTNKAVVRGNVDVSVLYKDEGGVLCKADFSSPVTEIIDLTGADEDMEENIKISFSNFTATPTASGEGEGRALFAEGKIFVEASCSKSQEYTVITDIFSTGAPLEASGITLPVAETASAVFPIGVSHIIPSEKGGARKISDITLSAKITKCESAGGELFIQGNADARILIISDENSYICTNTSVPFSYNGQWTGTAPVCSTEVKGVSASLSPSGDIDLKFTVSASVKDNNIPQISCIQSVEEKINIQKNDRPSLVVYFAREGDTLWSVAKHYAVKCDNIVKANKLSGEIVPGQRIVIPR